MDHDTLEGLKYIVDTVSVITMVGALAQFLPSVAALFTIVWTAIRIYETKTVQSAIRRKKDDA